MARPLVIEPDRGLRARIDAAVRDAGAAPAIVVDPDSAGALIDEGGVALVVARASVLAGVPAAELVRWGGRVPRFLLLADGGPPIVVPPALIDPAITLASLPGDPARQTAGITAQVRAWLVRTAAVPLVDGRVDLLEGVIQRGDRTDRLTPRELALLRYLAARPGATVSKEQLLERVWGYGASVESRTVYATVNRLRAKLEADPANPLHLRSVHGEGYCFMPVGARSRPAAAVGGPVVVVGERGTGVSRTAAAVLPDATRCDLSHVEGLDDARIAVALALGCMADGRPDAGTLDRAVRDRMAGGTPLVLEGVEPALGWVDSLLADLPATARVVVASHRALSHGRRMAPASATEDALRQLQQDLDPRDSAEVAATLSHNPGALALFASLCRRAAPRVALDALPDRGTLPPVDAVLDVLLPRLSDAERVGLVALTTFARPVPRSAATEVEPALADDRVWSALATLGLRTEAAGRSLVSGEVRPRVE